MSEQNNFYNEEERVKRILMWSGISFFMILFIFIWGINTSKVFKKVSAERAPGDSELVDWKNSLDESIGELKNGLEQFNTVMEENLATGTAETLDQPSEETGVSEENLAELKQKILDLENNQTQTQTQE